jgi:hypothetical protein
MLACFYEVKKPTLLKLGLKEVIAGGRKKNKELSCNTAVLYKINAAACPPRT